MQIGVDNCIEQRLSPINQDQAVVAEPQDWRSEPRPGLSLSGQTPKKHGHLKRGVVMYQNVSDTRVGHDSSIFYILFRICYMYGCCVVSYMCQRVCAT